jgi:hypothetical protein
MLLRLCVVFAALLAFYLVIILLNTGRAIAVMTAPNAISIISSLEISGMLAPKTMTFLSASAAYVRGRNFETVCMYHGICCIGKNTPLRNIIGNISVIMSICAVS